MSTISDAKAEMQKRFHEVNDELGNLELKMLSTKFKALEARDASAKKLREQVAVLRQRTLEAKQTLSEFSSDSGSAWDTFRNGMENIWEGLRSSSRSAYLDFTSKDSTGSTGSKKQRADRESAKANQTSDEASNQ
jgi:hypothetical protein